MASEGTAQRVWRWDQVEWEEAFEAGRLICFPGLCKCQEALPVAGGSQRSNMRPCLLVGWGFYHVFPGELSVYFSVTE